VRLVEFKIHRNGQPVFINPWLVTEVYQGAPHGDGPSCVISFGGQGAAANTSVLGDVREVVERLNAAMAPAAVSVMNNAVITDYLGMEAIPSKAMLDFLDGTPPDPPDPDPESYLA
jgi:hypothetical protein